MALATVVLVGCGNATKPAAPLQAATAPASLPVVPPAAPERDPLAGEWANRSGMCGTPAAWRIEDVGSLHLRHAAIDCVIERGPIGFTGDSGDLLFCRAPLRVVAPSGLGSSIHEPNRLMLIYGVGTVQREFVLRRCPGR